MESDQPPRRSPHSFPAWSSCRKETREFNQKRNKNPITLYKCQIYRTHQPKKKNCWAHLRFTPILVFVNIRSQEDKMQSKANDLDRKLKIYKLTDHVEYWDFPLEHQCWEFVNSLNSLVLISRLGGCHPNHQGTAVAWWLVKCPRCWFVFGNQQVKANVLLSEAPKC